MRRIITIGIAALAAIAILTAVAIAFGDKDNIDKKANAESKLIQTGQTAASGTCGKDISDRAALTAENSDDKWETRTIAIKGMTCNGCENSISAALAESPGVVEVVKVCHQSREAVVKVDPTKAQDAMLVKAVTDKGYQAEVIPAVAKAAEVSGEQPLCPVSGKTCADSPCGIGGSSTTQKTAEKKLEGTK